ncbi:hypothetical protein EV702DRAFT_453584 [Suillus placidus]|uniref:Uncharacterized protein n=1 Tax=Suillus placidus TaxID=48579 RepID=A0A9P6ZRP9_9AGAM|nr:hypothetical protein EV702DRAFT_453584 [Suillus placidus]
MRDNARLHAPSFSALSDYCHSPRAMKRKYCSHSLFSGFLISLISVSAASPWDGFFFHGWRKFSLSQPAIHSSSSLTSLIYLFINASISSRH